MHFSMLLALALTFMRIEASSDHQEVIEAGEEHCHPHRPSIEACSYPVYTVLGDSYAAGLSSYKQLPICPTNNTDLSNCTTYHCGKDMGAYGYQFQQANPSRAFSYIPCSGANTTQVLQTQVMSPAFLDPDLVTVSAGGDNGDVFAKAVEYCVYLAEEKNCGLALDNATKIIDSIDQDLKLLYTAIVKPRSSRKRTAAVTGYAQFWNALNPNSSCQDSALKKVTPELKQKMNQLVLKMNDKLKTNAIANGLLYVNVDPLFEGNRLCDNVTLPWFHFRLLLDEPPSGALPGWLYHRGVFHPTEAGQLAYKKALDKAVGC